MKCELKARRQRATIARVTTTFVALMLAVTFVHAWENNHIPALFVSFGLSLAIVIGLLGRFPE